VYIASTVLFDVEAATYSQLLVTCHCETDVSLLCV